MTYAYIKIYNYIYFITTSFVFFKYELQCMQFNCIVNNEKIQSLSETGTAVYTTWFCFRIHTHLVQ